MENRDQAKQSREKLKVHPKNKSCFLSDFFFCWELPIILKGWRKELTEDDLYKTLENHESRRLGDKLESLWSEEENSSKNPSLRRALTKLFGLKFVLYGLSFFPVQLATTLLFPLYIKKLLDYYTPNQTEVTRQQAYIFASVLVLISLIRVFFAHWYMFQLHTLGMKVRIACSTLIYRRCLKLKKSTLEKISVGQLINLLSNDVNRFDTAFIFLHTLWMGPVELIVAIYYMDVTLGHTATAGVAVLILSLFYQVYLSKKIPDIRMQVAVKTDDRIRVMNDVISGIQTVKMYTWEESFANIVKQARRIESERVVVANRFRLINNTLKIYITKCCVFLSVLATVLTGTPLTSQYIFALTNLYENIKNSINIALPTAVIIFPEALVSIQRIKEFLLSTHDYSNDLIKAIGKSEKTENCKCTLKLHQSFQKKNPGVYIKNLGIKWNQSLTNYVLNNINFNASLGELVGVIGKAGSGKSTLLQVILKELDPVKGTREVEGTISYACQEPWIFSASIRQNILFGQDFDFEKYQKVIKACALEHDIFLFPYGDQTLVGERGVMLSGGQKARINLARATYRDADIYLLDDPLSAVDSHVARQIFDNCILDYLRNKCVVLVTHQTQYLRNVDRIYLLESGMIVNSGKYKNLVGLEKYFTENHDQTFAETADSAVLKDYDLPPETKEHRSSGTTVKKIYGAYCSAAGHWLFTFLVVLLFTLVRLWGSFLDGFVTFWVNLEQEPAYLTSELSEIFTTSNCLYIFAGLLLCFILTSHISSLLFSKFCNKVSKNLHNNMLVTILNTTMTFFNHHPSGRILNRFSKDIGSIDEELPISLMNGITVLLTILATLVIVVVTNYWTIIPTVLLLMFCAFYFVIFQSTSRNLKRTEGITRSSVFTHISASIQGLSTIRALNAEKTLIQEFDNHQDLHTSAFHLYIATYSSFGFWTDVMCVLYNCLVTFGLFLIKSETHVGSAGLAISLSNSLLLVIQYAMKTWMELNAQMSAVERVVEYSELSLEPNDGVETPPESWPNSGDISFHSVSLRYSSDVPHVLKDVSFNVKPKEKIGIIGRTGAGKTSLISVLFRLFPFEGSVVIDKVDTKSIPLKELRSKITVIPQDPLLFLGTLRKNLDPFCQYDDQQLWSALDEFELKEVVSNLPSGLDSMVSERGSNFSVGQRQLLCLVRAMLRESKIVVLDEATSNVDLKTDGLIQSSIRKKFKNCTVLTIAHRLNTVMDSDKILVIDEGLVVEFGEPGQLLQNREGFFYRYVKKGGVQIGTDLTKTVENSEDDDISMI